MLRAFGSMLLLLVSSLSVVAQVQQSVPNRETPDAAGTGMITGRVVNESGQPVANAVVYVRTAGSGVNPHTASTDREGAFQVSGLDRAAYYVSAAAPAYITPPRESPSTPVPMYRPGDSVTLTLIKGGAVTGTVINAAGEPVVGVAVRVQMVRDASGRVLPGGASRERATDDRGIYRVYGLMTGTYVVLAGGPTQSSGSYINAFESDVPTYSPSSTRETAAEISVRTGEEVSGVDIRYRGEQGRTISGEVNVPSTNAGFTVTLTAAGEAVAPWNTSVYQNVGQRDFVFNGIADGDYNVLAHSYAQTGERGVSEQKLVSVRGADVSGVVLTAKLFGSVAGRLVLEDSKAPECVDKERPLFNETMVSAWHNDNAAAKRTPQSVWSMGTPAAPDADGKFVLQNLAAGEYYFVARTQAKHWYLRSISLTPAAGAGAKTTSKPIDATRVWTNVKSGDKLSELTITLAQGAASLRGRLVLGEGEQAPARLWVYLVPAERERAEEVLRFSAAQVSPEGRIAFNNVAPGRYWIMSETVGEGVASPLTRIRLPHETQTRARLRSEAELLKNEIELKPCQNVTGFQLPLKSSDQN
jgi:hypothetical protein